MSRAVRLLTALRGGASTDTASRRLGWSRREGAERSAPFGARGARGRPTLSRHPGSQRLAPFPSASGQDGPALR